MTGAAIGVRAVLAGAYRGRGRGGERGGSNLTHAILVGPDGWEAAERTVCGRIDADRLCDVAESGAPTCPTCARRSARG